MTNLNIQQELNIEVVSTEIIKKLYKAALSVLEPLEGELDAAYMSGNLLVDKTYRAQVSYLTTRFPDLHINVTTSYYIPFEDSNVQSVLMANNISSDGIGITEADAATANLGTIFKNNTTITSFDEFRYFTKANTNPVNGMFEGCTNLSSIDLSNIVTTSASLFTKTSITDINAPNLITLSMGSFSGCSLLETITNLGHVSTISDNCFRDCENLESVTLPEECRTIEIMGFGLGFNLYWQHGGSLTRIDGLNNVSSFGNSCLYLQRNLHLYALDLANAGYIGQNAFMYVLVHSINSPKLTLISYRSFRECKLLTTIECLGKISNVAKECFASDTALQTVKLPYECTEINNSAFSNCSSLTSIKQYTDSVDDWVEGVEPTTGPLSRVTNFGLDCFEGCSLLNLTQQDIQNAATIGKAAFVGTLLSGPINLSNLTTNYIAEQAFLNTKITSVTLPSTVTSIGYASFASCTKLTTINLSNITSVDRDAFRNCTELGAGETLDITLGSSVRVYDQFGQTAYKKLILHGIVSEYNYKYPVWEGMPLLLYLDTSDFYVPSGTTWGSTYGALQLTTVIIHPNYTDWEWRGTEGLPNLQYCIILSPTPPVLGSDDPENTFFVGNRGGNATIYVVDETAKSAYLADAKWSRIPNLSIKMKTLAELPVGVWTTGLSSQYLNS